MKKAPNRRPLYACGRITVRKSDTGLGQEAVQNVTFFLAMEKVYHKHDTP